MAKTRAEILAQLNKLIDAEKVVMATTASISEPEMNVFSFIGEDDMDEPSRTAQSLPSDIPSRESFRLTE